MREYIGCRWRCNAAPTTIPSLDTTVLVFDHERSASELLNPHYELVNHSPTGFEWSYSGSGPAQLALAILCDAAGSILAKKHHLAFRDEVIARLPRDRWTLKDSDVHEWVSKKEGSCNASAG